MDFLFCTAIYRNILPQCYALSSRSILLSFMPYRQLLMFHIFLLLIRNTLAFKNRRKGLADKSLINGKHGSLSPRAWSSYSLLSINWSDIIINIPCLPNYLLLLAQIEAICIHKEPFIYFLSSLFSVLIFYLLPFPLFLSFFPPVSFPVNV